jgi:tetratricopeptide (TPR) repeat protein
VGRSDLKLVAGGRTLDEVAARRRVSALGGAVLLFALLATALGADRSRVAFDPAEAVSQALLDVPPGGTATAELRSAAISLRRRLGSSPSDARTRAIYAGTLLELDARPATARAASFHAGRAADLSPVSVPVVSGSAIVLASAGEVEKALELSTAMFAYDAKAAARLLLTLSPLTERERIEAALPPEPSAWLAWVAELRNARRQEDADRALEAVFERWPRDPAAVRAVAEHAVSLRDWERLREILPAQIPETDDVASAALLAYRARLRAETGDPEGARLDAGSAARRAPTSVSVLVLAGDAMAAAGSPDEARRLLSGALYRIPGGPAERATRVSILARQARLYEREGKLADAVRAWRAVENDDPANVEARSRLDRLPGGRP